MEFKIGDYVRIASDYPFDTTLQNQTGNIVALPTKEQDDEYTVKLDGGITQNEYFQGKARKVSANWLRSAKRIKPRP